MVTFTPQANFGTCLQAYALYTVLSKKGYDVEFIFNGHETLAYGIKGTIKDMLKSYLPSSLVEFIRYKKRQKIISQNKQSRNTGTLANNNQEKHPNIIPLADSKWRYWLSKLPLYNQLYKFIKYRNKQMRKVYSFAFDDKNFKMKRIYTAKQYEEIVEDADLFITGSDQIWNPYCCGYNPMFFLEFVKGRKKCISYSSSIARPSFPNEIADRVKQNLSQFTHIAVRERSSVELLKKLLLRDDINLVVDPTYLLNKDEWMNFGNRATIEFELPPRYILCYFIGFRKDDYRIMVEDVKNKTGIKDVVTIDCVNGNINYGNGILYKDGGPYEFIYLLSHASMACMDSFHATIFSLIFRIDFVHILKDTGDNTSSSQNIRMYDILKRYNLVNKLYDSNNTDWTKPINWEQVEMIMNQEISKSISYLNNALSY